MDCLTGEQPHKLPLCAFDCHPRVFLSVGSFEMELSPNLTFFAFESQASTEIRDACIF
jgi:hypothetical protein